MATIMDIISRRLPAPWRDGDNIPWHDAGFSRRMLREHLAQHHDLASRRSEIIDAQVEWIASASLPDRGKVLDLACGPGLYAQRLAQRGHECVGVDYSPASIAYAQKAAAVEGLSCAYICEDLRTSDYGSGHDLAMLISGELNSFAPDDTRTILSKARAALVEGGVLLIEAHTMDAVRAIGARAASWYAVEQGLFSDAPHVCLQEHSWNQSSSTATVRYFIVDGASGEVGRYATTKQAYTEDAYRALLGDSGFAVLEFYPSLRGDSDATQQDFVAIAARRD